MSLAIMTSATDGAEFDIDPSAVESVARVTRPAGLPSVCVVVSRSGREYHVAGDLAAVRAALRPPVAAAVEVAPTDLERAADVLDLLAMACKNYIDAWDDLDINAIDRAIGVNSPEIYDTRDALRALAAKLRGGG